MGFCWTVWGIAMYTPGVFGGLRYYKFRRTTLISIGCAAFLVGVGAVKLGVGLHGWWWLSVTILLVFCRRQRWSALVLVAIVGVVLGLWRGGDMQRQLAGYNQFFGQKITAMATVSSDPTFDDKGATVFYVQQPTICGNKTCRGLPGQMRVSSFTIIEVRRGDTVSLAGKMQDGFGDYQASLYYATLSAHHAHQNVIDQLRYRFAAGLYNALPDPQASLGLGFLVGIKTALPAELNNQLKIVGLTHIVVASGYNLTILVRLARRAFEKRSKYQTAIASIGLIVGFVLVTGFSSSMSRAALVSGLALAAWYYGRVVHPMVLLLMSAALTTAFNPLYIWSDIGWWLSFLAFGGVMLLSPLLQRRIFGEREPKLIGQVVLETISAELLTLPLIVCIFGTYSVVSLAANVLIVPLVPLAMLFSFGAGVVGMIAPPLAGFVGLPATWLLTYMTEFIRLLASPSWASLQVSLPAALMLAGYGAVVLSGLLLWRKLRFHFLRTSVIDG